MELARQGDAEIAKQKISKVMVATGQRGDEERRKGTRRK